MSILDRATKQADAFNAIDVKIQELLAEKREIRMELEYTLANFDIENHPEQQQYLIQCRKDEPEHQPSIVSTVWDELCCH